MKASKEIDIILGCKQKYVENSEDNLLIFHQGRSNSFHLRH